MENQDIYEILETGLPINSQEMVHNTLQQPCENTVSYVADDVAEALESGKHQLMWYLEYRQRISGSEQDFSIRKENYNMAPLDIAEAGNSADQLAETKLGLPENVLDIGAGIGSFSLAYASKGADVLGIEQNRHVYEIGESVLSRAEETLEGSIELRNDRFTGDGTLSDPGLVIMTLSPIDLKKPAGSYTSTLEAATEVFDDSTLYYVPEYENLPKSQQSKAPLSRAAELETPFYRPGSLADL